jgi:hypothetical protein
MTDKFFLQITCVVTLYIWCAATNPGDPGIFKAKKHPKLGKDGKQIQEISEHESCQGGKSFSDGCSIVNNSERLSNMFEGNDSSSRPGLHGVLCLICNPFFCLWKRFFHSDDQSSEQHMSEEGMFFCSLCEVEVCYKLMSAYAELYIYFLKKLENLFKL